MKYFLGGENSTMHVVRRMGRLRERESGILVVV